MLHVDPFVRNILYSGRKKLLRCLSGFLFFTRLGLSPHQPSPPWTAKSGQFVRFGGQVNFPFSNYQFLQTKLFLFRPENKLYHTDKMDLVFKVIAFLPNVPVTKLLYAFTPH